MHDIIVFFCRPNWYRSAGGERSESGSLQTIQRHKTIRGELVFFMLLILKSKDVYLMSRDVCSIHWSLLIRHD